MSEVLIKDVQKLLSEYIGSDEKLIDVKETPLVAPGENYGSLMIKLDITLETKDGEHKNKHFVAKLVPQSKDMQDIFNVKVTVKREINFYTVIVPALQSFQRECGVKEVLDFFPKLCCSRLNLDGKTDEVDEDSVIIMENMKESGFCNVDRLIGSDLITTRMILKDLATLHAVPIAMKLKNHADFENVIKLNCIFAPLKPPPPPELDESRKSPEHVMLEMIYECDKCLPYMAKVKNLVKRPEGPPTGPLPQVREPFASICHGDMWVNNYLIKFQNGTPVKNVFIDFQMYSYDSPLKDLMFFLFSSVENSVLQDHLDDLIKHYYECFIGNLKELGCEIDQFSWDKFQEEIKVAVSNELVHALIFLSMVVFGKKRSLSSTSFMPDMEFSSKNYTVKSKERFWLLVQECGKRNWI